MVFPITYHSALPNIPKILASNLHILHRSERCKKAFPQPPMVAWRKGRDIASRLTRTQQRKTSTGTNPRSAPCASKKCAICPYMDETNKFQGPVTDSPIYTISHDINCKSTDLVYAISCTLCKKLIYVGETGDTLYNRIQNHLSLIRNNNKTEPVPIHFNKQPHTINNFRVVGLEKQYRNNKIYRQLRESFWIKKLDTINHGVNRKQ